MESWEGYNYYTTNTTTWVQLMNLSTAEFGLGHFPHGVRAIAGALNGSAQFPDDAFIIEHAGQGQFDQGRTASIVFGAVSGLAFVLLVLWICASWKTIRVNWNTMVHPPNEDDLTPRPNSPTSRSTGATELASLLNNRLCEAKDFKDKIYNFYYEPIDTEVELAEKTPNDPIDIEDIEAVITLVRKMYSYDIHLYGIQNVRNRAAQRLDCMRKSDAILSAVRNKVSNEWAKDLNSPGGLGWTNEEANQLSCLVTLLERQLPRQRYQGH